MLIIVSKFEEAVTKYKGALEKMDMKVDDAMLHEVAKGLGPSIYNRDASLVSCSDKAELERVKKNYLMKKLGWTDEAKCDAAIQAVCKQYTSNAKHRAVFYYLLRQQK